MSLDFLNGGGEMGARMRAFDWASTPLGAPSGWPQSLKTVVERSEQLARLAPEDPEHLPELGPQRYASVNALDQELATASGAQMVAGSAACIERARAAQLVAAGFSEATDRATWIANRRGLSAYHRSTEAGFSTTVRTPAGDGSGWAAGAGTSVREIDHARCAERAIDKFAMIAANQ